VSTNIAARPAPSPNRTRAAQLLVGGLVGWHAGLAAAVVVGILLGGTVGMLSALIGAALTLVYYAIGQGVQIQYADAEPRMLRAASVWSYMVRVGVLGALLWGALQWPSVLASLDARALFTGIVLGVLGWLTGLILRFRKLRIPVFDEPEAARDDPSGHDC
jgi:hypothetical protein